MQAGVGAFVTIFTAIVGLALVAVVVSQRAQTSSILQALGTASASVLGAATAPVTASTSS